MRQIKRNMRNNKKIVRIILFTILVLQIAYIFHNSLQVGDVSEARRNGVLDFINDDLGMKWVNTVIVSKLAHFVEYSIEGLILGAILSTYFTRYNRAKNAAWFILGGVATGMTDEMIQFFVEGRGSRVYDVWVDSAGIICGIYLMLFIISLIWDKKQIKMEN